MNFRLCCLGKQESSQKSDPKFLSKIAGASHNRANDRERFTWCVQTPNREGCELAGAGIRLSDDKVQNEQNGQQVRHSTVVLMSARKQFNDGIRHEAKCQALRD